MRSRRPVAVTLVAVTAGLAASAVLRRIAARRRSSITAPTRFAPAPAAPVVPAVPAAPAAPVVDREAVVLTFAPRTSPEPAPQQPVRCGDTGGRTKAGAPCGARAAADGRCRHHRIAA